MLALKKEDKNVHRFALSAIRGELLEKEREREIDKKKCDKKGTQKKMNKKFELR